MQLIHNWIDGAACDAARHLPVYEPATGQQYAELAIADEAQVNQAVTAARAAFPGWSATTGEARAAALLRLAGLIEENAEALALAESRDSGKPLSLAATVDIPRAAANFRFFAAAASQFASESHHSAGQVNYTLRQPLGPVACVSPWNLPLYLLTWKVAPALAAGNTVVAKPSEVTPMTASLLAELSAQAGLPKGVLNIVNGPGEETGAPLVTHPDIQAVSFTGSTRTGRWIAESNAAAFRKLSLEMGGKNPALVFADCDFEQTVDGVLASAFRNQGQICLCGSRILVEDSIYERFRDALVARASALRVGDPLLAETDQGALVSREHYEKVRSCLERAVQEGGRVLCGGKPVHPEGRCEEGWFLSPALVEGLGPESATNQEEIFGPVASLQPFSSESQALELANQSSYGLAASLWTRDLARAHRLAAQVRCGIVWVNCWMARDLRTPFGGMGQSGLGREGGFEAMRFFTEPRNICLEY